MRVVFSFLPGLVVGSFALLVACGSSHPADDADQGGDVGVTGEEQDITGATCGPHTLTCRPGAHPTSTGCPEGKVRCIATKTGSSSPPSESGDDDDVDVSDDEDSSGVHCGPHTINCGSKAHPTSSGCPSGKLRCVKNKS